MTSYAEDKRADTLNFQQRGMKKNKENKQQLQQQQQKEEE